MAGRGDLALAMDVGGTNIRVAVIDRDGSVLQRERYPTQAQQGTDQAMERLTATASRLMLAAGDGRFAGVGIALGSPVDPETGIMYNPPSLPGWDGFSPKLALEESLGLPVHVANDATLGAVGEYAYGVGQSVENLVYITVSTGIGGGVIVDGIPIYGMGGFAGELGHMSIDKSGLLCNCGNTGCLEALASGTAIARNATAKLEQGAQSAMREMADGDGTVRAEAVMEAAAQGDPLAAEVLEQFTEDLGQGLTNLLHIFNPEMIVLGGGVCQNLHLFFAPLKAAMQRRAMAHLQSQIPVVASVLEDDASILGAAHLVFEGLEQE